jgi:hypothetical protein
VRDPGYEPDSEDVHKRGDDQVRPVDQCAVPSLVHVARIVENDEALEHGCAEEGSACCEGLPGEDGDPASGVAPCCSESLRGKLDDEVVLAACRRIPNEGVAREFMIFVSYCEVEELTWKLAQTRTPQLPASLTLPLSFRG